MKISARGNTGQYYEWFYQHDYYFVKIEDIIEYINYTKDT